jgi:hypothetical protein
LAYCEKCVEYHHGEVRKLACLIGGIGNRNKLKKNVEFLLGLKKVGRYNSFRHKQLKIYKERFGWSEVNEYNTQ